MYVIPNIEFIFQCRVRENIMYSNFMSIQVCMNAIVVTQVYKCQQKQQQNLTQFNHQVPFSFVC